MGVFVVDVGGGPRAMVGPVAKGYETSSPIAQRLDDERALSHAPKTASWREAFAVPAPATPALGLEGRFVGCGGDASERRIAIRARASIGKVSVTLLDHHGDPLGPAITIDVDHTWKIARFSLSPAVAAAPFGVEALHVRVHDLASAGGEGAFDYTTSPSVFAWKEPPHELLPRRPRGAGDFTIGVPARETRRTR